MTCGAVLAAAVAAAAFTRALPSPLIVGPALLTMTATASVVAGWPRTLGALAPVTAGTGLVSAAGTLAWLTAPGGPGMTWTYLHTLALLTLITLTVRRVRPSLAIPATAVAAVAEALLAQQVTQPVSTALDAALFGLFWSLGTAAAVGLGLYLRALDVHREHAVLDARRAQRVQLARDLHDFVAHDVSAMVVQAQAARVLLSRAPEEADAVLREIEQDGTRALAAMDRTVRTLRELEGDGVSAEPLPGLDDLPELVSRFAGTGFPSAELVMTPPGPVPREVGTTVYRVVVEALTNIRKHALPGSDVTVAVTGDPGGVRLTVADRPPASTPQPLPTTAPVSAEEAVSTAGSVRPRPLTGARAGLGLVGLAERVTALGGTFDAGRAADGGWAVTAVFP
ncbi:hypothetical protein GCM10009560_56210 [Nonomuraea longicatena]|uniref:histidine kinase n=2 Tax=Nonomuraea longicatena TaxID=83682 RepID=A0ABP4AY43_9ACTN